MRTYSDWKRELAMTTDQFVAAFERYCEDMGANTRVLEWSCKVTRHGVDAARFLHTARHAEFDSARPAIDRLYATLERSHATALRGAFFMQLPAIAEAIGQGIAVGYAANRGVGGSAAELKVYVATSRVAEARAVVEAIVPEGALYPDSTRRIMIAASIDEQGRCGSRVYYLWDRRLMVRADVRAWLDRWCTPEERALIAASETATVSIAFKQRARDMIYLSAPFNYRPLNQHLLERLRDFPLTLEALGDLRWLGFSKRGEGLRSDEVNVYFSSAFQ